MPCRHTASTLSTCSTGTSVVPVRNCSEPATWCLLTRSRTSLASLVIAIGLFAFAVSTVRVKVGMIVGIAGVVCLIALAAEIAGIGGGDVFPRIAYLGRHDTGAASLTGRVPLWHDLARYVEARPWLGFGYGGFWTAEHIDAVRQSDFWTVTSAHSAYLELALGVGLIGVTLYVVTLLASIGVLSRFEQKNAGSGFGFSALILLFCLVHGLLESATVVPHYTSFLAWTAVAASALTAAAGSTLASDSPSEATCAYAPWGARRRFAISGRIPGNGQP